MFNAKVKETAAAKKSNHETFAIDGEMVSEFTSLKSVIDNATGKLKMIEGKLKDEVKRIFAEQYAKTGKRPDNFKIMDESGLKVMGLVIDKYLSCDQSKYEVLKETELVEEKTTFSFNPVLLEKYQSVIENLLLNCPDIDAADKELLIEGVTTFNVKKGAIDELKGKSIPLPQMIEMIQPIIQLKIAN